MYTVGGLLTMSQKLRKGQSDSFGKVRDATNYESMETH
jgi:hypothetical protein